LARDVGSSRSNLVPLWHDVLCVTTLFYGNAWQHRPPSRRASLRTDATRRHLSALRGAEIYNRVRFAATTQYPFDSTQTTKMSVHDTTRVLSPAKCMKMCAPQASTSEVHGDSRFHPQIEGYSGNVHPIGARSFFFRRLQRG